MVTREQVLDRLRTVKYPGYSRDIVSFGMVKDVQVEDSRVKIHLHITTQDPKIREAIATLAREQVESMPGVSEVEFHVEAGEVKRPGHAPGIRETRKLLEHVRYKIAVASGKGGVGKTTVAVNLALALARRGAKVGILDADIYGPNIPIMMGVHEKPRGKDNKILPMESYGVKLMSIGFFLDENSPIIWRGPLVGKAIEQLLTDVLWEDIDYFIVDLPPGTGDAQLSISSLVQLSGAIIVSTPQDVALEDAVKGVKMFQKVNVPILGIVENMSYFLCPHCGERTDIFAHGGAKRTSEAMGVPFLGEIPLDPGIREGGDHGKPIVAVQPESPQAQAFLDIADRVLERLPTPA
jgi:ATP-binding protein involved in chromosome partitioning